MMRNMIAILAVGAMVAPSVAMAATAERPAPVSYAAPSQFGKSLTSGRTGLKGKGNESNLEAGTALFGLIIGGVGAGVACHETDLCGSNGKNGSISPP